MIEFDAEWESGREAYRQVITEDNSFRLTVGGQLCEVVNLSENGIAYRAPAGLDDSLIAATLEFELDGRAMLINCNLQRIRETEGVHCCFLSALSDIQHLILSRYIMQCQKKSIRAMN